MFRASVLRQSDSRNCGLRLVYMEKGEATLLVGTWNVKVLESTGCKKKTKLVWLNEKRSLILWGLSEPV